VSTHISDTACIFIVLLLRVGTAGQLSLVFIALLMPRHATPLISLCRKRRPLTTGHNDLSALPGDIGRQVQLPALRLHIRNILGLNPEKGYPTPSVGQFFEEAFSRLVPGKATHGGNVWRAMFEKQR
jgi:hypothetical protein